MMSQQQQQQQRSTRRAPQFGSALFYRKVRNRTNSATGQEESDYQPESRFGRCCYAIDCCRTKRRATVSSVICVCLMAIAVSLGLYFAYHKDRPDLPTVLQNTGISTESEGGGGVLIPINVPTFSPTNGPGPGFSTLPPFSPPSFPPPVTNIEPLGGPCDTTCRLQAMQAFLGHALQRRNIAFPLQTNVQTLDDRQNNNDNDNNSYYGTGTIGPAQSQSSSSSGSSGFVNTPQTQAMLYLALHDPAPLLDFDKIPRTTTSGLMQFFASSTSSATAGGGMSDQTFRLAVAKFGLATLYHELNAEGTSTVNWLNTDTSAIGSPTGNSGSGGINICEWDGIVCDVEAPAPDFVEESTATTTRNGILEASYTSTSTSSSANENGAGRTRERESVLDSVGAGGGAVGGGRRLRQSSPSKSKQSVDDEDEDDEDDSIEEEELLMVRSPRKGGSHHVTEQKPLYKNRGQMLDDRERRSRRRAQQTGTGANAANGVNVVNSQTDPFVIRQIRLPQRNLTGQIASALSLFGDSLEVLDLSRNRIGGNIPSELWTNQRHLKELHLYQNQLNGTLQGDLLASNSMANSLTELYLDENQLVGNIPSQLGKFINLQRIDLFGNRLFDTIPTQIGQLTQLTTLWLSDNQLGGRLPTELCQLTKLQNLYLDVNFFFDKVPTCLLDGGAIQNTIVDLRLNRNLLAGTMSSQIGQMTNLKVLYMDENDFDGSIPPEWSNITTLEHLAVGHNRLTGQLPESLSQLTNLKTMNISGNLYENSIIPVSFVENLMELERLLASDTNLLSVPDLSPLHKLRALDLGGNPLLGAGQPMASWLTAVNAETGQPALGNLEELRLNNNGWTGPLLDLSGLTKLSDLTLHDNALTGILPEWLGTSLKQLKVLNVRNNFFSGFLPQSLATNLESSTSSTLKRLDVSGTNQILGQVPDQVCASLAAAASTSTAKNDEVIVINCSTLQCPLQQYPNCCTCG
jgi:Leucine-rich repeat (LRR) protein